MLKVVREGVILDKTKNNFENEGVLNPAAIRIDDEVHLFYRAVSKGNYSSIGYCKLDGAKKIIQRDKFPLLFPQVAYESHGIEDPRITKIDDVYYLSYTVYDGVNALGALATSLDLKTFTRHGIITPKMCYDEFVHLAKSTGDINEKYLRFNQKAFIHKIPVKKVYLWDKNVIFFPRKINGKFHFLHRIRPDIQIVRYTTLDELTSDFWQNYILNISDNIVLSSKFRHEVSYIGGGCPPIETELGWLLIYHGVHDTINGYVYSACAALLDLENPQIEIARLPYPLFKPELSWELNGEVNNVCFPTGAVVFDETLYVYYGAADERIALASMNLKDLLSELILNKIDHARK
jgi:beta-1,2-mannobiose phosphorylase / 1,2-beta-oligomannan phosphorylase